MNQKVRVRRSQSALRKGRIFTSFGLVNMLLATFSASGGEPDHTVRTVLFSTLAITMMVATILTYREDALARQSR